MRISGSSVIRTAGASASPDIEDIATELRMSRRTLQRRLTAEQTSYRALLEEVRQTLARELLVRGLPVAVIARQLGFTEVSSFSQAFRRWEGTSPTTYRHGEVGRHPDAAPLPS